MTKGISMGQFRKKPVVIEARRFWGDTSPEIAAWCGGEVVEDPKLGLGLLISTLEGTMRADAGDWIIKGVQGEFYPCKPDIFKSTYEAVSA